MPLDVFMQQVVVKGWYYVTRAIPQKFSITCKQADPSAWTVVQPVSCFVQIFFGMLEKDICFLLLVDLEKNVYDKNNIVELSFTPTEYIKY